MPHSANRTISLASFRYAIRAQRANGFNTEDQIHAAPAYAGFFRVLFFVQDRVTMRAEESPSLTRLSFSWISVNSSVEFALFSRAACASAISSDALPKASANVVRGYCFT